MNVNRLQISITAMLLLVLCPARSQDTSRNYAKTVTMLDADGTDSLQAVQYYNGLSYPTLSVANAGTGGGTAYTLTTYDALGREKRKYVPVPGSGLGYLTESNVSSMGYFYMDSSAFTENHYDALDRVTAVDIAGDAWRNAGKQDRTEYLANTQADEVLHYEAPEDGSFRLVNPEDASFQYYPAGSLSKSVSYDADDVSVTVFSDLLGNRILERTAAGDTYYVYNDLGQLRFVLAPAYTENLRSKTMFAYEYRYDYRGRMNMKILPKDGSAGITTQYWYDRADRMAYMKDPALGSRYRFFLYDRLGRLCIQGTCSGGDQDETIFSGTSYTGGSDGICGTGYTLPYTITDPQLEIVSYYDNYGFLGTNLTGAMPSVTVGTDEEQNAFGFLTGQVVYATNGEALGTVNVYDIKGQVLRSVRKGLGGHLEDLSTDYTFTGDVESASAEVGVGYGVNFTAETGYTYEYGRKTAMSLSVSHGRTAQLREVGYDYDAVGRLSGKQRQLTNVASSPCTYSYDVHSWLTSINSGGFQEILSYADGLDGGCYNGNISTVKWKTGSSSYHKGYNLEYDGCNRLTSAVYGEGNSLTSCANYFSENVQYDCNGNITHLQRRGLVNNMYGTFGLVDDLTMTYAGNQLTSVRDDASHYAYAGATDFDGVSGQEYPLTYNDAGSLTSDAGRRIAWIDYDLNNNPVRIQFTNGSVTRYVYSAAGEKLRVTYQTAVPNISVPVGSTRELASYEIQYTDSTDYLLGGRLTLKNGRIDKYLFEEGYCQAESYVYNTSKDNFTFCYYDRDHLGNIRQVREADGTGSGYVIQTIDYYQFGAELCDGTASSDVQPYRYNGKEFDKMHGLNTYDYGARQYYSILGRWDRVDPLCEKYYSMSPYVYCGGNPVNTIDFNGLYPIWNGVMGKGARYFDSDTNEELSWGQVSNYIYYGNYEGRERLKYLDSESSKTITPWGLGVEWLTGEGERIRYFGNNDYLTKLLKKHSGILQIKKEIAKDLSNKIMNTKEGGTKKKYDLSGFQGIGKYIRDYLTLFTGGKTGNLAATYLGSYDVDWSVIKKEGNTAVVLLEVTNFSTLQSGTRPPVIGYTEIWKSTIGKWINNSVPKGAMSATSQKIVWIEYIKIK